MKALFAGSFDPIHRGHQDLIERVSQWVQELHIVVANSLGKRYLIPIEKRVELIRKVFPDHANIQVHAHAGLISDYAKQHGISYLIRGLRSHPDFDYEQSMAWHNQRLYPGLETLFLMARPEYQYISSRAIKELLHHGQKMDDLVPAPVAQYLSQEFKA